MLWIAPLLYFTEDILLTIGQDATVSKFSGDYNRIALMGLPGVFMYEAYSRFLMNRSISTAPTIISGVTCVLHVLWAWYFILQLELENAGAGLANCVTWYTQFCMVLGYVVYTAPSVGLERLPLVHISRKACSNWARFLAIGIPSAFQTCGEWWFWEICALLVGYLGSVSLAAHVATLNYIIIAFMPTIGISQATSTLVGQAIGDKNEQDARRVILQCVMLNSAGVAILSCLTFVFEDAIVAAYSNNSAAGEKMTILLHIYFPAAFLFDSTQNVAGSALRGLGLVKEGSLVYLVCFYGFMLPLSFYFAFPMGLDLGVEGVYYAMICGTLLAAAVIFVLIHRSSFEEMILAAEARNTQDDTSPMSSQ